MSIYLSIVSLTTLFNGHEMLKYLKNVKSVIFISYCLLDLPILKRMSERILGLDVRFE
jgi:hypothetical protein